MQAIDRVRPVLLLLLGLFLGSPVSAQVATLPAAPTVPERLSGLDSYIEQAVREWEIPGLAIAVVQDDRVVYARGFGERRLGSGAPVDEHTLFAIASTTKAMTVAGLGMLVSEDVLDWDDPVTRYLPEFQLEDPFVTRHVTIRDLLTHRTGVSRSDNVWIAAPFDRAEIVRRARYLPQSSEFRGGYGYNNIMYMVAGEVLAAAAGVPWATFIETRLFEPLGMERSTPRSAVVARRDNVSGSHVLSDGRVIAIDHRDYDALGPAGSVFSSAWEMAQWLRLQLNYGEFEGRRLLDSAAIAEMHEPQNGHVKRQRRSSDVPVHPLPRVRARLAYAGLPRPQDRPAHRRGELHADAGGHDTGGGDRGRGAGESELESTPDGPHVPRVRCPSGRP